MKQFLPYNVLLVMAVALMGAVVLYNLVLRDAFAVTVAYTLPVVPKPDTVEERPPPEPEPYINDEEYETGAEYEGYPDDESYTYVEDAPVTSVTFPLDLNLATEEELRFIPQVGDVMAQRIVQYREVLGGYETLDQLKNIKGVGDETFSTISAYLIINAGESGETNEDN